MFFRKKKEKPKKLKKLTSIAFVMAIPANFILGSIFCTAWWGMLHRSLSRFETVAPFFGALALTILVLRSLGLSRFRVFLHESKHALLVLMTGNIIKGFHVEEQEGNVQFQMYKDRVHYGPFITLAPYCFPLFTIPALIFAVVVDRDPKLAIAAAALLGFGFGVDVETAFHDLHPQQTDFKQILGGFPASGLYIASVFFLVGNVCLLWAFGGRDGFLEAAEVTVRYGLSLAHGLPIFLRYFAMR